MNSNHLALAASDIHWIR